MKWLGQALEFLFGCHHSNMSRVFTIHGQSYQICCECGAKFYYSLANMSMERRVDERMVAPLRRAQALRSAH